MKLLELFVIVIILAVGMFGFAFMSGSSTSPSNVTDTFGKKMVTSTHVLNTTDSTDPNAQLENITVADSNSYDFVQNVTAIETQGAGAGIIIVAACVVLLLIFAMVVLMRGAYSKNKYRT